MFWIFPSCKSHVSFVVSGIPTIRRLLWRDLLVLIKCHLSLQSHSPYIWCFDLIFHFPTLPNSSSSWPWVNSMLFINWPMSAEILSKRLLVFWTLEWINSVMFFSWFWNSSLTNFLLMLGMYSFSLLTSWITF